MGVYFDPDLNNMRGMEVYISFPYSPVKVLSHSNERRGHD